MKLISQGRIRAKIERTRGFGGKEINVYRGGMGIVKAFLGGEWTRLNIGKLTSREARTCFNALEFLASRNLRVPEDLAGVIESLPAATRRKLQKAGLLP